MFKQRRFYQRGRVFGVCRRGDADLVGVEVDAEATTLDWQIGRIELDGGVISPGEAIIRVAPVNDSLVVDVKVQPADIDQLHMGQGGSPALLGFQSTHGSGNQRQHHNHRGQHQQ
ncbi:type I secretion membrane fusion protein, HlyD family [compost metagenome]